MTRYHTTLKNVCQSSSIVSSVANQSDTVKYDRAETNTIEYIVVMCSCQHRARPVRWSVEKNALVEDTSHTFFDTMLKPKMTWEHHAFDAVETTKVLLKN